MGNSIVRIDEAHSHPLAHTHPLVSPFARRKASVHAAAPSEGKHYDRPHAFPHSLPSFPFWLHLTNSASTQTARRIVDAQNDGRCGTILQF